MSVTTLSVFLKKESPNFKEPIRATDHAGAWDVFATEIIQESEDCYVVKLGFSVEFHPDFKLMVAPRSSITKTKWNIQNTPGIGDSDFRGEYSIRFRSFPSSISVSPGYPPHLSYPPFPYEVGDRVAQIYFQKRVDIYFIEAEFLNETTRGSGAFGSTGK